MILTRTRGKDRNNKSAGDVGNVKVKNKSNPKPPNYACTPFRPKVIIPDGFMLIVDTREQDPLFIPSANNPYIIRDTLKTGDYSIKGFESIITIERKSLSDLYGTFGTGRDRFERELQRAKSYAWKSIVIEADETDIYEGQVYSSLHPNVVYQTLASMESYNWHVYMSGKRNRCRYYILSRLVKWFNHMREGKV